MDWMRYEGGFGEFNLAGARKESPLPVQYQRSRRGAPQTPPYLASGNLLSEDASGIQEDHTRPSLPHAVRDNRPQQAGRTVRQTLLAVDISLNAGENALVHGVGGRHKGYSSSNGVDNAAAVNVGRNSKNHHR